MNAITPEWLTSNDETTAEVETVETLAEVEPVSEMQALLAEQAGYETRLAPVLVEIDRLTSTSIAAGLSLDEEVAQRKASAARLAELAIEQEAIGARLFAVAEAIGELRNAEKAERQTEARSQAITAAGTVLAKIAKARADFDAALVELSEAGGAAKAFGISFSLLPEITGPFDAEMVKLVENVRKLDVALRF